MSKILEKENYGYNGFEFKGSKLELRLTAQSPMIHFQYEEPGVTLRGSELKPKLDKFLCKKAREGTTIPLDYKVRITCDEKPEIVEIGVKEEQYSMYYGDSSMGVWSDPIVTIICFDNELKKLIAENIVEFFCVTNFGTMQNKGFGSFIPTEINQQPISKMPCGEVVSEWLRNHYEVQKCWRCQKKKKGNDSRKKRCIKQFKWIKCFYGVMKSGQNFKGYERSFLFNYMHKKSSGGWKLVNTGNIRQNIDNEKAWMKRNGIAPTYPTKSTIVHSSSENEAKYVRAFMGLAGIQQWKKDAKNKVKITVTDSAREKEFERIPSPVVFKIIGDDIYFIIGKIPDNLYDYEFKFSNENTGKYDYLKTPSKSQFVNNIFDTEQFMTQYVEYYNSDNIKLGNKNDLESMFNKIVLV